jgi:uncharacterized protein YyaL (SSP411 family)
MLYDNAQLARACLHAYLLCRQRLAEGKQNHKYRPELFRRVCEQTIDFVRREMTHPEGGFFSSLDADSEGQEGKFYVWTMEDNRLTLPDSHDQEFLTAAYGLTERGNFEGANILQQVTSDWELGERFGLTELQARQRLEILHLRLLEARAQRIRPGTDDKVLTSWNALMLLTVSEAARYLERDDYREMAVRSADFLLARLLPEGRLLRSWRNGSARHDAYLEDHAALILALLSLYQTDPQPRWFQAARSLTDEMIVAFAHTEWGFFDTRADAAPLLTRPRDVQDNATPSGNALASQALLEMAAYTGSGAYRGMAEQQLGAILPAAVQYPTAFGQWLNAADFALGPVRELAVIGDLNSSDSMAMRKSVWGIYRPRLVTAFSPLPPEPGSPELLQDRPQVRERTTAYVCENFTCQMPVTEVDALEQMINDG